MESVAPCDKFAVYALPLPLLLRQVLELPVCNSTRCELIEHEPSIDGFKVTIRSTAAAAAGAQDVLYARKVVLATGIQVRGSSPYNLFQRNLCVFAVKPS